jgi:hypothetical protein
VYEIRHIFNFHLYNQMPQASVTRVCAEARTSPTFNELAEDSNGDAASSPGSAARVTTSQPAAFGAQDQKAGNPAPPQLSSSTSPASDATKHVNEKQHSAIDSEPPTKRRRSGNQAKTPSDAEKKASNSSN